MPWFAVQHWRDYSVTLGMQGTCPVLSYSSLRVAWSLALRMKINSYKGLNKNIKLGNVRSWLYCLVAIT